jgi:hypothetical protein
MTTSSDTLVNSVEAQTETSEIPFVPLTPEQGSARSAFIDFFWNLQLAIARKSDEPGLSPANVAIIESVNNRTTIEILEEGNALWDAWIATGGHDVQPAIFTKENIDGYLQRLKRKRFCQQHPEEFKNQLMSIVQISG